MSLTTPNDRESSSDAPDETVETTIGKNSGPDPGRFPAQIGQYTIKRVIASGGMGTVYEALQENPRRPAAVKVIRHSMASGEVLRRFEREAQALARLRHPGIAQIYEAGTYEDAGVSLPFFALEYIPNARTLNEYARAKNLTVRQKLELFLQVCEAVHYGHQRGIIHRDLKPGNILVDSEGRVRVIDFGVARAIDADQEQADFQTQVGQIVGTAQYMSPEQFEADPNDLDTRSDVYALGVVLYELLSGQLPYAIAQSGVFEIARIVRKEPPIALGSVVPGLDGEVELITAKALQKPRDARYQSASGLADDIRRHLKGEAISAKPTSLAYQARVFARKNKAAVGLASAVVALLLVGVVWTSKLYVDVSAARTRAEMSAEQAIAANEFLKGTLSSVVPPGFGDVRTIGDLCDQMVHDIDGAFPNDPTTEADIRSTIGQIYSRIDKREQAERQLRKSHQMHSENLGRTHETSLQKLKDLNAFYFTFGPPERYLEAAIALHEVMLDTYGPGHVEVHNAVRNWIDALEVVDDFAGAERKAREYLASAVAIWGEDTPQMIDAMTYHAMEQLRAGQIKEARITATEAFNRRDRVPELSPFDRRATKNVYASALIAAGDLTAAKDLYGHRRAPESFGVDREYQGTLGAIAESVQVLVFFETWCPYSQRYVPQLENLSRQYRDLGVNIIGLTKVDRSSSDASVRQFITANEMSFSVLKENGRCSNYFDLTGVPATVVLHEGEVIWNSVGAGWLDSYMLEGIVNAGLTETN